MAIYDGFEKEDPKLVCKSCASGEHYRCTGVSDFNESNLRIVIIHFCSCNEYEHPQRSHTLVINVNQMVKAAEEQELRALIKKIQLEEVNAFDLKKLMLS
jgi:hypothetical protein